MRMMKPKHYQPTEVEVLAELHKHWKPHAGQIPVGKAVFHDKRYLTWVQCGRKFGKSEIAMYCLIRWALLNPRMECYYVGPFLKQVKRIAWRRILLMIPKQWVKHIDRTALEITLVNDTVIILEGSDNPDASRGFVVNFCVYEEFKDFKPEYHDECMGPNLDAFTAPLVVIGTPPSVESFFTVMAEEAKNDPEAFYMEVDCYANPHINHQAIKRKELQLIARGEWAKVQREYYGRFIKGGQSSIFPMLKREKHVMQHEELMAKYVTKDASHLEWYCMADPGTTTAFGVLYVVINPYTKRVMVIDNILETQQLGTSTLDMWPRMTEKAEELHPDSDLSDEDDGWYKGYDQAGAWFANEIMRHHGVSFIPTDKTLASKDEGISVIKDLLNLNMIVFSDRCEELLTEMENYQTDKNGKVAKKNDHLIDCLRYVLAANMYDVNEVSQQESAQETRELVKKSRRMEDEVEDIFESFIND